MGIQLFSGSGTPKRKSVALQQLDQAKNIVTTCQICREQYHIIAVINIDAVERYAVNRLNTFSLKIMLRHVDAVYRISIRDRSHAAAVIFQFFCACPNILKRDTLCIFCFVM